MKVEELACKVECQELLARLCQLLDRGANSEAADLFAEDAVLKSSHGEVSGAAIRTQLQSRSSAIATRHVLTNVIITPTGPTTAKGTGYILVYRTPRTANDTLPRPLPATPQGAGDWVMEFRKTDAAWYISSYSAVSVMEPAK